VTIRRPILLTRPGWRTCRERAERPRRAEPAAPHRLARGGFRRVPALAPAAGSVRAGIQARGRRDCGRLGRRQSAAHSVIHCTRWAPGRAGLTPLEAITAATRRGAQLLHADHSACWRPAKSPTSSCSRQPHHQHRGHAQHRTGHDPRPDHPAGFPESDMEIKQRRSDGLMVGRSVFLLSSPPAEWESAAEQWPVRCILQAAGLWMVAAIRATAATSRSARPRRRGRFLGHRDGRDTVDVSGSSSPRLHRHDGQSEINA